MGRISISATSPKARRGLGSRGRQGQGLTPPCPALPSMWARDLSLPPQVGARLGANLPWGPWCGGRKPGTAAPTRAASGARAGGRSARAAWCQRAAGRGAGSAGRTAAPASAPSFPRGLWRRRRAAGSGAAARAGGGCRQSERPWTAEERAGAGACALRAALARLRPAAAAAGWMPEPEPWEFPL